MDRTLSPRLRPHLKRIGERVFDQAASLGLDNRRLTSREQAALVNELGRAGLRILKRNGYITERNLTLYLTDAGMRAVNLVPAALPAYLRQGIEKRGGSWEAYSSGR
jgi:hypothetical protein